MRARRFALPPSPRRGGSMRRLRQRRAGWSRRLGTSGLTPFDRYAATPPTNGFLSSCQVLSLASIPLRLPRGKPNGMDCRVKPGNDGREDDARSHAIALPIIGEVKLRADSPPAAGPAHA